MNGEPYLHLNLTDDLNSNGAYRCHPWSLIARIRIG